ncbi:MAG: ABC transporter permease [Ancrocorticia sp.]|jgi:ABC-2 type transport system permease protein|nr:ABC transporter permease [Ancrocorticia sp.]
MTTYLILELKRVVRDPFNLLFTVGIPAMMYVVFGVAMGWGDQSVGRGNSSMYVMISMAAYGAVTATTSITGMAAVERMQGWGRQLALTPMRDTRFVAVKTIVSAAVATVPLGAIYLIGYFRNARATGWVWLVSALTLLFGSVMFSLYGLAVGLAFRSESSVGIASGFLVILGFLGNVFLPLSGVMLTIAKFTPLYGVATLARWPLTDGGSINTNTGELIEQPLWQPLANVVVWTIIFALLSTLLTRRTRRRQ